ncbi:hypothetical protein [Ectobacillus sp. sgz5001026]|uniref:hypothetical protein n=1 Tax=Ectobacillus sp. sgz5001026 TaxID=3242473 RepID=UPI0036D311FF
MSFPNIPSVTPTISLSTKQTIPLLLASIAFEELALAHIMNAEAEKIQFVLGTLPPPKTTFSPATVSITNLIDIDTSVQKTLRDVIKKEMLLEFKFENVLDLIGTLPTCTPATASFSNNAPITNIDLSNTIPYPSTIDVAGLQGSIAKVTVTINDFFDPNNTSPSQCHLTLLVVAPDGTAVLIFAEAGNNSGSGGTPSATFTIDDDAATVIPQSGPVPSGTFKPSVYTNFNLDSPAPQTAPYPTTLSTFVGKVPNGTWSLFAFDEFGGHGMEIRGGWALTITTACL